jgi:anti-sigma regulatory factor (Ser/Thr protein kinase)
VPLNRPAEPLAPGPRGAAQARRWVGDVCVEIGRDDLRENAELAMSEVVTNAILHGKDPVTVRLRGTRDHPRVEVRDASPDPPALVSDDLTQEFLDDLPTFGRGLAIVASFSEAWGAERDGDGKLVWFVPASAPPDRPAVGVVLGWDEEPDDASFADEETITVRLRDVPVDLMQGTLAHGAELRRELRLLAVAHQDTYPVASDLSAYFTSLARDFRAQFGGEALTSAIQAGHSSADLDITAPLDAADRFGRLMELYDLADAFCRNERLLTLARSEQQVEFQTWLFGEFVRQGSGEDPVSWTRSRDVSSASRGHP